MTGKVAIWGASGHALVVADILRLRGEYDIAGFIDDVNPERQGEVFCGAKILGGREQLNTLKEAGVGELILGFGNCEARLEIARLVGSLGFRLITAVHPKAVVAGDVSIGPGTVIAAGAVINPGANIGANVIINTCASVDHECVIEDGAHVCPGAHLAGRVIVHSGAWIGIGATVIEKVTVGAGSIIGAGAVVVMDIPDRVVAYGIPAKVMKRRDEN